MIFQKSVKWRKTTVIWYWSACKCTSVSTDVVTCVTVCGGRRTDKHHPKFTNKQSHPITATVWSDGHWAAPQKLRPFPFTLRDLFCWLGIKPAIFNFLPTFEPFDLKEQQCWRSATSPVCACELTFHFLIKDHLQLFEYIQIILDLHKSRIHTYWDTVSQLSTHTFANNTGTTSC